MKKHLLKNRVAVYTSQSNRLLILSWLFILTLLFCLKATANDHSFNGHGGFDTLEIKFPQIIMDAQDIVVTGQVTNITGEPLFGVSVKLKESVTGTTTDAEGKYSINIPENGVLLFSSIGYVTQEILVNNRRVINIKLVENTALLGEVVVTALGIQRSSKSITFSVQKVGGR